MKVLQLAPAWEPIPPPAYGGTEAVVADLVQALAHHSDLEIILAASADSTLEHPRLRKTHADVPSLRRQRLEDKKPHEWLHISHALRVAQEEGVDLIHNHAGELPMAFAPQGIPMLTTAHCLATPDTAAIWRRQSGWWNTISNAQYDVMSKDVGGLYAGTVYNAIDVGSFPFGDVAKKQGYLLFIGRMSPEKGPHIACKVAQDLSLPLLLAGKIDPDKPSDEEYFRKFVQPLVDGDRICYVGEAGAQRKRELYRHAIGTLMPIKWEEPFGLVMAESLACGTPVIACARGAAPEIVQHGITGYLISERDEQTIIDAMAEAVGDLERIDPADCRRAMEERFDVPVMANAYAALYERILARKLVSIPQ